MTTETDRFALLATKLRLLVDRQWPEASDREERRFPDGAVAIDRAGSRTWVLMEGPVTARLGAALAVGLRAGSAELHLLVEDTEAAAVLARRAECFASPPHVWVLDGAELRPATAAPPAGDAAPPPEAELYRPVLEAAGLTPMVEGGNLLGELLGLEVGRVVVDDQGAAHVEAGVGRFDREIGSMMFAEMGEADALAQAVELVARFRRPGAERHPVGHLVPERWLRAIAIAEPAVVGARELQAVGSAVPRRDLKHEGVASSVGVGADGDEMIVVCSTGVFLDLVPSAADDRLTHAPDARLVLLVPERDAVPVTTELNALLREPAEIVTVSDGWRDRIEPDQ